MFRPDIMVAQIAYLASQLNIDEMRLAARIFPNKKINNENKGWANNAHHQSDFQRDGFRIRKVLCLNPGLRRCLSKIG